MSGKPKAMRQSRRMSHSSGNRRIGIGETPPISDLTPANARPGNWFRPKPALFAAHPPVEAQAFFPLPKLA